MTRLKHLQPSQWESWQRKANDPEWYDHRYHRNDKRDQACVALALELQRDRDALLEALKGIQAANKFHGFPWPSDFDKLITQAESED